MRKVWLSDRPNHQRPCAVLELNAYMLFPEDEPSRLQALMLIEAEYCRWQAMGGKDFQFSNLVQTILTASQKSFGHRYVTGLVGLAMQCLRNANRTVSLETAAKIVSEYANTRNNSTFRVFKDGQWVERAFPVIGDLATIKRRFRSYRSVAHICATQLATAEYLKPRISFEHRPDADACFIATALVYQNLFRGVGNYDDWNLWEIQYSPPDPETLTYYAPSIDSVRNLIGPWLNDMEKATSSVDD